MDGAAIGRSRRCRRAGEAVGRVAVMDMASASPERTGGRSFLHKNALPEGAFGWFDSSGNRCYCFFSATEAGRGQSVRAPKVPPCRAAFQTGPLWPMESSTGQKWRHHPCCCSSVVERVPGKRIIMGSSPISSRWANGCRSYGARVRTAKRAMRRLDARGVGGRGTVTERPARVAGRGRCVRA